MLTAFYVMVYLVLGTVIVPLSYRFINFVDKKSNPVTIKDDPKELAFTFAIVAIWPMWLAVIIFVMTYDVLVKYVFKFIIKYMKFIADGNKK